MSANPQTPDVEMKQLVTAEAVKGVDADAGTVTAWVSTEDVDRDSEVLVAEGCDLTHYRRNPVLLPWHDMWQLPLGKADAIEVRPGEGIEATFSFGRHRAAQDVRDLYVDGIMRAFSVGFRVIDVSTEPIRAGQHGVTILKWELREVSAVPVPANPFALVKAARAGNDLAPGLLRIYYPDEKDANEEARAAVDLRRALGGLESLRNHLRGATKNSAKAAVQPHEFDALWPLADELRTLLGIAPADVGLADMRAEIADLKAAVTAALTPPQEPDPAPDGALSDDGTAAVLEALAEVATLLKAAPPNPEALATATIQIMRDRAIGGRS